MPATAVSGLQPGAEWSLWSLALMIVTGLAAGVHGMSILVVWIGDEEDRRIARTPARLGLPLACLCLLLLIAGRQTSTQHTLDPDLNPHTTPSQQVSSLVEMVPWPLALFTAFSAVSVLAPDYGQPGGRPRTRVVRGLYVVGALGSACVLGSGAGASLDTRNPSPWLDATWISPLLLGSSVSMGLALLLLVGVRRRVAWASLAKLERLDLGAMALQGVCVGGVALMLGDDVVPSLGRWPGLLIPTFVVPIGWVLPLAMRSLAGERGTPVAAVLVLVGAIALRAALVGTPAALLAPR